jgi:serine protease Do
MRSERQKLFSLAAIVVASVLFGMVIAGALNLTPPVGADRADQTPATAPTVVAPGVPDFATLADRVIPSVVSVFSTEEVDPRVRREMPRDPFHFFFGPRPEPDDGREVEPMVRRSSGSGFFISAEGEIITNFHVVEEADSIEIELSDDTRYKVTVVGRDPATDIALLKVEKPDRRFPALDLGESEGVRVGEWVMAVGNPLAMDHTATVGVVSGKGRVLGLSDSSFENFIQTDAAINLGNSGGPLVNLRGEVIGINSAINAAGENLGFAVPINTVKQILPQLRERGRVVRGYLGISVRNVDQDTAEAFRLSGRSGAFVEMVVEGHAADKGGVKHGDVIVDLDGEPVADTRDLIDTVSAMAPGTKVKLGLIRDGKRMGVTIELEERLGDDEAAEADDAPPAEDAAASRAGLSVTELTPRVRQYYGIDDEIDGVVISRIRPLSPAGEEGLDRGDVITEANGRPIADAGDLLEVIDGVEQGGFLRLYVHRSRPERSLSFFAILKLDQ